MKACEMGSMANHLFHLPYFLSLTIPLAYLVYTARSFYFCIENILLLPHIPTIAAVSGGTVYVDPMFYGAPLCRISARCSCGVLIHCKSQFTIHSISRTSRAQRQRRTDVNAFPSGLYVCAGFSGKEELIQLVSIPPTIHPLCVCLVCDKIAGEWEKWLNRWYLSGSESEVVWDGWGLCKYAKQAPQRHTHSHTPNNHKRDTNSIEVM